jgi:glycosyltransferase involved in cell wall biosynthesis
MGVPFVISPRGMLHPAAFRRRAWKKKIAFEILEHRHLTDAAAIHATVEEEAAVVREFLPSARIVTIPNAVDVGPVERRPSGLRQRLGIAANAPVVAFLGRLHPIKRIDLLVEAFAAVRERHPSAVLLLAGPDEGGLQLIARAREQLGASIKLAGAVDDEEKWGLLGEVPSWPRRRVPGERSKNRARGDGFLRTQGRLLRLSLRSLPILR